MTKLERPVEAEHELWFRQQVTKTLRRLARGEARLIPHDQFWREIEAHALDLLQRREG